MKKKVLCISLIIGSLTLIGGLCRAHDTGTVQGSGVVVTETRNVPDFTALDLSGAFTTTVTCGKARRLDIRGDDNIVKLVRTEVKGGKLFVYPKKSYSTQNDLQVTITVKDVREVAVSGANTISLSKIDNASFKVDTGGSSTVNLSGRTNRLDAKLSGGATLSADNLKAEVVKVDVSGAGNADVNAAAKLDVNVSGVGNVRYKGNPEVSKQIMGVGDVNPM